MKYYVVLLFGAAFLLMPPVHSAAQTPGVRISGYIKDSLTDTRVELATITLVKDSSDKALKITYSNDAGWFEIHSIATGNYMVVISHTGFADKKLRVSAGSEPVDLGVIRLTAATNQLTEVRVKYRKTYLDVSDDKIVYNVQADPLAKTQTAMELLRNVPFGSVDGDANIRLK
ncbi:MAG: carboxypeptidase regulatory-like domain-containing protein, partial [Flavisolibacter sp.]|nr:carboxypeptidase regulatory-like domain-containing protein [Flavisolibacter sp.]